MGAKERSRQIFIFIIVGAFVLSSLGFTGLVIWELSKNKDQANSSQEDIQKQLEEQLKTQNEEGQMNAEPLDGYSATPFDKASINELKVETLKQGNGKAADAASTVKANYFGWTSDGKIFDSSKKDGVVQPIEFPLDRVIPGWTQGLTGVKQGSVVKLTIPANLAYGENGSPPSIGPNEPLVFIVELTEVQ